MAKYDITSEAKEDLYRIWEYTSAFNEIASVENKPGKSYDEIMSGLKAYHIRRHMIFYLIQENSRVLILRILHEKMDYPRHLSLKI